MSLDLEPIKERLVAATPCPWHCTDDDGYWCIYGPDNFQIDNSFNSEDMARAEGNRQLIGHAPEDIAALIAEVERLTQQRDAAIKACEATATDEAEDPCYYDHHGYCQAHGLQSKGECYMELARAALRLMKEASHG